jgi:N6-adenosine-specific RNA methylase IME4
MLVAQTTMARASPTLEGVSTSIHECSGFCFEEIMNFHPIAELFPMLEGTELETLARDIKAYGLREPITTYRGEILDGRNRYAACVIAEVEPTFREYQGDESGLLAFVVSANLHRRHLNETQRAGVASKIANMERGGIGSNQYQSKSPNSEISVPQAAEMMNVGRSTIATYRAVAAAAPDLVAKMDSGEMTANKAFTETKRRQNISQLENIEAQEIKHVAGVFDVIVIDPPWEMEKIERDVAPNQVAFDYPTMTTDEICDLEIPCADDCHIWLWTTHKYLPEAFAVLDAWNLKYVCMFTWHKPGGFQPFGLPQYNSEFCLYARKGVPKFIDTKDFYTCFDASRGKHSEKPQLFYDVIRRVTAGRRLDMFNRRTIEGFETYGNEAK